MKKAVTALMMLALLPSTVYAAWEFKKKDKAEAKSVQAPAPVVQNAAPNAAQNGTAKKAQKPAAPARKGGRYVVMQRADGGEYILDTQTGTVNPPGITTDQV